MADEIDQIRSRISIVDLVSQKVALRRTGRSFQGLCPFHEDRNPSFTVNPEMGRYRCWSCGASGDIFNWVMETQRVDFAEALSILADQAGVTLTKRTRTEPGVKAKQESIMARAQAFFVEQLKATSLAQEYCANRGLTGEVIAKWGLGYSPTSGEALVSMCQKSKISLTEAAELFLVKIDERDACRDQFRGRLMIPIRSESGKVIAFGGRIIGDGQPKYINSSDTPLFHKSHVLFGLDQAKEAILKQEYAVLVEGYMDVIACHRAGVESAVASLGTSLTEEQVKILKRWCRLVVVFYDRDEAGQKAAEKATDLLLDAGLKVRIAVPPPGDDPDSILSKGGASSVQRVVEEAVSPLVHRVSRLREQRSPHDPSFWDEASFALSYASSLLELEQQVAPLAAIYPNAPDKNAAMDALRRMAEAARKKRRQGGERRESGPAQAEEPAGSADKAPPLVLLPAQRGLEGRILGALFQNETVRAAWAACSEPGLFRPGAAAEAAAALSRAFPAGPPSGEIRIWLSQVEEPARTLLGDLHERPSPAMARAQAVEQVDKISLADVEAAVEKLREHRTRRELDVSQLAQGGDEAVFARIEEMRRAKGGGKA
jgi:DNA primase